MALRITPPMARGVPLRISGANVPMMVLEPLLMPGISISVKGKANTKTTICTMRLSPIVLRGLKRSSFRAPPSTSLTDSGFSPTMPGVNDNQEARVVSVADAGPSVGKPPWKRG
jgi:hypothetical protein